MTELMDPPEPTDEEDTRLKAKNLKNLPLILKPTDHRTEEGKDGKPWEYVECDVWVLDRTGITAHESGVRFSWWRARNQIKHAIGKYIACRPREQDDNSVILVALSGEARTVAEKAMESLAARASNGDDAPAPEWDGNEPI